MRKSAPKVRINRRELILMGIAAASAVAIGSEANLLAAEAERKVIKEAESVIPGYKKIRLRETIFPPGASTERKMPNAMICECTEGSLEVRQNGKTWTAKRGDIWTCHEGMIEGNANRGTAVAVMRVFDLLP